MSKRKVQVGHIAIGGDAPVSIQSMTNTDTSDIAATVAQIHALEEAGCDIVRLGIFDETAARAVEEIKKQTKVPLVADIHFDYKLALICMENGIDKVRINPGNIGDMEKVRMVADQAKSCHIPIRIGVNSGSLEKNLLEKYGHPCAEALVESALSHAKMLEECGFYDIVLSLKASNVMEMISSYELANQSCQYPLHLGVTEAGTYEMGIVKSSIGIGSLLSRGIGNTIRVSLTEDPVKEVAAAKNILRALSLRKEGVEIVSCPTCGRCHISLIAIAKEVERRTKHITTPMKIAVMGCVVNGPGEAREADLGLAGGNGEALIFSKGEILKKVPQDQAVDALMAEIQKRLGDLAR